MTFDPGSDIYLDRQVVAERLAYASQQLPAGVKPPVLTPLTSSSSTVLVAGLTSKTKSLMDLRTVADWTVRLRLLAVPGVSKVAVFGGDVRSIQVQVHPDALVRYGVGLEDVVAASRKATAVRGAGFLDTPNQRIVFRSEGQAVTPAAVGRTVVTTSGAASVVLSDVATIADAPEPSIGGATIMGQPGVVFVISAQFGANTQEVTQRVEETLATLRPALEIGLCTSTSTVGLAVFCLTTRLDSPTPPRTSPARCLHEPPAFSMPAAPRVACSLPCATHGFTAVAGLDPSPRCAAVCRGRGFEAYAGSISTPRLSRACPKFDCVVFSHVLEHVYDIPAFFTAARRARAGRLLVSRDSRRHPLWRISLRAVPGIQYRAH